MSRTLPGWWSAEVEWYQQCAASEHGLKAQPLEPSLGGPSDDSDDYKINAAGRARRITLALRALSPRQRTLMLVAHDYVCPRRPQDVARASRIASEAAADLLVAAASFRSAWLALGPSRRAA